MSQKHIHLNGDGTLDIEPEHYAESMAALRESVKLVVPKTVPLNDFAELAEKWMFTACDDKNYEAGLIDCANDLLELIRLAGK
jgi:hypothetical protein